MKPPHATPTAPMRALLLILCCSSSWALANEMPETEASFDRGSSTDRETKSLDEWMEEHGEALPPREQQQALDPPATDAPLPPEGDGSTPTPPTGDAFSGELQPFAVTLVDKTLSADLSYAVTGCAPNQSIPMLDNGVPPDTRAGDSEYTAMSTLCPFGSTPVVVLEGDTPLWQ